MSNDNIKTVLNEIVLKVNQVFGEKLDTIFLYGSYARGDYNEESDIDIALLLDMNRNEISLYMNQLIDIIVELNLNYGVLVSFSKIPLSEFNKWKYTLPYYMNIEKEGVKLVA